MNKYLMEVQRYFGMPYEFVVQASDRDAAMLHGKALLDLEDNLQKNTLRIVKKVPPTKCAR